MDRKSAKKRRPLKVILLILVILVVLAGLAVAGHFIYGKVVNINNPHTLVY